jgi:hypothetical protein
MTPSHHTSRFATLIACAIAAAGVAVPLAQASPSESFVTEHSASQNRVDLRNNGNYGPLDPVIAAATLNHQSVPSVPLITEHAAGQNGNGQSSTAGKYGPLDPLIAAAIHNHQSARPVPLITEHAAGQNGNGKPSAAGAYGTLDPIVVSAIRNHSDDQNGLSRSAATSVSADAPNGFDWGAAGIGAAVAFAAMLLGLGVTRLVPRRSRARLA